MQTGGIQALKWPSVEFSKRRIVICESYKRGKGKNIIESFPKQKNWRVAVMPELLVQHLLQKHKNGPSSPFVCPAAHGGMLEQKKLHNGLTELCRYAGVKRISPHEMRHTCTELWLEQGASAEDVRRQLNQSSTETTKRYIHRPTTDCLSSRVK